MINLSWSFYFSLTFWHHFPESIVIQYLYHHEYQLIYSMDHVTIYRIQSRWAVTFNLQNVISIALCHWSNSSSALFFKTRYFNTEWPIIESGNKKNKYSKCSNKEIYDGLVIVSLIIKYTHIGQHSYMPVHIPYSPMKTSNLSGMLPVGFYMGVGISTGEYGIYYMHILYSLDNNRIMPHQWFIYAYTFYVCSNCLVKNQSEMLCVCVLIYWGKIHYPPPPPKAAHYISTL